LGDGVAGPQLVGVGIVPLEELLYLLVITVEEDLAVLITSIQTFAAIIADSRAFYG